MQVLLAGVHDSMEQSSGSDDGDSSYKFCTSLPLIWELGEDIGREGKWYTFFTDI